VGAVVLRRPDLHVIPLGLPQGRLNVLAIGAHPDDIEIGCGGTLLTLAASGRDIDARALVLTGSGERVEEAQKAAPRFLTGSTVDVVGLPDGRLPAHWGSVKESLEAHAAPRPDVIFAPRVDDAHQDHRLVAELVTTVWRDTLVLRYEIPKWDGDLGSVSHYVPIEPEVARLKYDLLTECFPSQAHRDWWDEGMFLGLMRVRGMECRSLYAEAFTVSKARLGL
jgi:LmbE family N-acetylglucosaminyl deacetylase